MDPKSVVEVADNMEMRNYGNSEDSSLNASLPVVYYEKFFAADGSIRIASVPNNSESSINQVGQTSILVPRLPRPIPDPISTKFTKTDGTEVTRLYQVRRRRNQDDICLTC